MSTAIFLAAVLATAQVEAPAPQDATQEESLDLRYARVRLELAQANLKRVEQMNQKLDRTVPGTVVADFKNDVATAELQLERAVDGEEGDEFAVWLRRAENNFQSAQTRWRQAEAANRQAKDTIPAIDIERFRLRTEVARLQWQRGQQLTTASRGHQLAWQVDLLNDEVDQLKEETSRVAPFVRYYPIWMY